MSATVPLSDRPREAGPDSLTHRVVPGARSGVAGMIACLPLALLLGAGVIAANRFGIALTPDSAHYLSAARNLALGNGLRISQVDATAAGITTSYTAWPPLYPVLVSAVMKTGSDAFSAAVIVNAAAMILLAIAVAGIAGRSLAPKSRLLVLAAIAGLPALLEISAFAWSEPVFIAFTYVAFWCLSIGLKSRRPAVERAALAGAGVAAGLATATRYLGLCAATAAGVALLLYHGGRSLRFLWPRFLAVTGPAVVFAGVWFARNAALTGEAAGQPRLAPEYDLPGICAAMTGFMARDFSGNHPGGPALMGLPVAAATLCLLGVSLLLMIAAGGGRLLRARYERLEPVMPVLLPLAVFAIAYYPGVAILGSLVHRIDPPATRFLAAGYPGLLLLLAAGIDIARNPGAGFPPLARARNLVLSSGAALLVLLLWTGSARFLIADDGAPDGKLWPYWRTRVWARSDPDGDAALSRLDGNLPVWTNVWEVVDLRGARPARKLPAAGDPDAIAILSAHPGAVYVDTRFARGVLTRGDLLNLSRRTGSPITFEGDDGHVALFRVLD